MSLPLPRRIVQAALLLGAAAAPLIGAGAAHAAAAPQLPDLGGLTNLDGAGLGDTVDGLSQQATGLAAGTGTRAMRSTVPTTGHIVGTTGKTTVPAAQHAAGSAGDSTGRLVGATSESATGAVPGLLPGTETLPTSALPTTGLLPTSGLATDQLPLKGLPLL